MGLPPNVAFRLVLPLKSCYLVAVFFEVRWLGARARSNCWRAVDPFPCLQTDSEGSNRGGQRRGIAFPFPFPPQCSSLNGVCPPDLPGMKCHISD